MDDDSHIVVILDWVIHDNFLYINLRVATLHISCEGIECFYNLSHVADIKAHTCSPPKVTVL